MTVLDDLSRNLSTFKKFLFIGKGSDLFLEKPAPSKKWAVHKDQIRSAFKGIFDLKEQSEGHTLSNSRELPVSCG